MVELSPMFLTNLCYTAQDFRRETTGLVCGEGVSTPSGLKVTTGGSGLDLFIAAGSAYVQGDNDPDQGMYFVNNDAQVTLTATTADPTNPRIDTVVATVRDSDYGGVDDDWVLQILPGTPTVGATLSNLTGAAAVPDSALLLAHVLVPATFTGPFVDATHIKDERARFTQCGQESGYVSRAYRNSSLNITTSSATSLSSWPLFDGSVLPTAYFSYNAGIYTILKDGLYTVDCFSSWAANGTGYRRTSILINGATYKAVTEPAVTGIDHFQAVTITKVPLTVGTTIQMQVTQSSGGNLALQTGSYLSVAREGLLAP